MSSWQTLTNEQLENLPTHRLLQVYQKQRKYTADALPHCGCPTNCYGWNDATEAEKDEYDKRKERRIYIKSLLDTREHIGDNKKVTHKTGDPKLKNRDQKIWAKTLKPAEPRVGPITNLDEAIGKQVAKISLKPFKSTLRYNTVTEVTINPHTRRPAFAFEEDTSIVDAHLCKYRN